MKGLRPALLAMSMVAILAACSPAGGPSASAEAEQRASASQATTREWAREDLIVRSSASNVSIPAVGVIARSLAEAGSKNAMFAAQPVSLALARGYHFLGVEDGAAMVPLLYTPTTETFSPELFTREEFNTLVQDLAALGEAGAAEWERRAGPMAALLTWDALATGDYNAWIEGNIHYNHARVAARWCTAPLDNSRGWPFPALSRQKKDLMAIGVYIEFVEGATQRCAALVNTIAADLGPIAYADRAALDLAVQSRMAAFTVPELLELAKTSRPSVQVRKDFTGVAGHAWTSEAGRFENEGSGWVWRDGGLTMFDAAHVYGRELTIQLASMASGTQRRALVGNEAINAEAVQRAAATLQAGGAGG